MRRSAIFLLRCSLALLLFGFTPAFRDGAFAQVPSSKTISLEDALSRIEKKFQAKFAYEHDLLAGKFTTEKALEGDNVEEVLKNVLYPNNLIFLYVRENAYSIVARNARFFNGGGQQASAVTQGDALMRGPQSFTLRGLVVDEAGAALPFVDVWLKGTRTGTQTTERGEFTMPGLSEGDTLVFSYVGHVTRKLVVYRATNITVQLPASDSKTVLDDVTVVSTGLLQLPKERATGSFATIGAKELEQIPIPNVLQRLEGQLSGVKISVMAGDRSFLYGGSGNQLAINGGVRTEGANDYNMAVRGASTFLGETFPLIVVDGAITDLDISTLNPNDIENITFLKDAAAASIWGIRAANGVMVINTKRGRSGQSPNVSFSASTMVSGKPDLGYLRLMSSAQEVNYETELVNRGFLNASNMNASSYYTADYYPHTGAVLALELQAGTISQGQYTASVDSLDAINNTGQIQKYLLQAASNQQYNVSVNGGNNYSNYFYSASYSDEKSNTKRNDGQRLTLTMNNSWKLFKTATLTTSLKGSFFRYQNDGLPLTTLYAASGEQSLLPYMQLVNNTGKSVAYNVYNPAWTSTLSSGYLNWTYDYLDELNNGNNVQKDNNYTANISLKVPLYKGLSATGMYSNERLFSNHRTYYDPATYYYRNELNYYTYPTTTATTNNLGVTSGGIYSLVNTTVNNYAIRGQLAYDRTIGRIHQVNAIAGSEIRQTQEGQGTGTLYGYNTETGLSTAVNYASSPGYTTIAGYNNSVGGAPTQQDKTRRYLSYFSNAAYTLLDKYSISASARYDDYNNFGLAQKYRATPLWSGGAKWNIGKEDFLKNQAWISHLGIRATYGVNGNISTTTYPFTNIALTGNDYTTGLPYATIISVANPELRWEKTYVTNLGLDYGFFRERLTGSVDLYRKNGKDLLYSFPIDAAYVGTIGGGYLQRNTSSMTGKGLDANVNGVLYADQSWTWSVGLTFSFNTNKVTDSRFDTAQLSPFTVSYTPIGLGNISGYSTDKLFVFRNAGLNASGLTRVYSANKDTVSATGTVYFHDLKYAGHTTAPYFGSWNTNLRYKQFTLYALLTYQFGGVFVKPSIDNYITSYYNLNYSVAGDIAKRWEKAGDEKTTDVPGLNGTATQVAYSLYRYQYSDANVLSSDYIRLREVSVAYQIPTAWIGKRSIKGASLAIAVRNLGLLWSANKQGYDPDFVAFPGRSYSLPAAKSYNFSLNMNF